MSSKRELKGADQVQCSGCGKLFDLVIPCGGFPGGLMVEGKPACWGCAESVMQAFENRACPSTVEKSK